MADDEANEDQWLYGESGQSQNEKENENDTSAELQVPGEEVPSIPTENADESKESEEDTGSVQENGDTRNDDSEEDSDEDDDVQVTIGEIKTAPDVFEGGPVSVPLKRLPYQTAKPEKQQVSYTTGGVTVADLESVGVINGEPAHDFNLDALEDKPWRKPGADITDYFNYGFNEETWRSYCERHRQLRAEAGAAPIVNAKYSSGLKNPNFLNVRLINDNSKYSGMSLTKKAGPPPMRRMAGTIDVIGGSISSRRSAEKPQQISTTTGDNVIEVMTGDKHNYEMKQGIPDMSVPPPGMNMPPPSFSMPPPSASMKKDGNSFSHPEYFGPDSNMFQPFEPTRDSQWKNTQEWSSDRGNITTLTGGPPSSNITAIPEAPIIRSPESDRDRSRSHHRSQSREHSRGRERDDRHSRHRRRRSDSRSPDRHRHRRSRSRSSSRSRHRSHKRSKRDRDE